MCREEGFVSVITQSAQSDDNCITVDDDEGDASIPTPKRMHVSKGDFVYSLL